LIIAKHRGNLNRVIKMVEREFHMTKNLFLK
jgi:hypothetical protein